MSRIDPVKGDWTDLHTHILPDVDDGARSMEMALELLRWQKQQGVERVILTPHFYSLREESVRFLERRNAAWNSLLSRWDKDTMPQLKLGAEVHYSAQLIELDLRNLCLGDSRYLLLELSDTVTPAHIEQVICRMLQQSVTPILAHIERCYYFRQEPDRLLRLIKIGALAQVSTASLDDREDKGFSKSCLQNRMAQIVASDIHNLQHDKIDMIRKTIYTQEILLTRAELFARAVWNNQSPPVFTAHPVKKAWLGYR